MSEIETPAGETKPTPKRLKFKGKTFTLPPKMPFNATEFLSDDMDGPAVFGVLGAVLGSEQVEEMKALNLDLDEGLEFLDQVTGKLQVNSGK